MPYETELDVRYRDIDAMNHVNNAVYATYCEQARMRYFDDVVGDSLARTGAVLASLSIDYERPIELEDGPVTVGVDVDELGTSSISMTYEIHRADGARAAVADAVQVAYDRDAGTSRPLPEEWREAIVDYHDL